MKNCKRDKIGHFFDNLMWYTIYLLPLICMLIYWCIGNTGSLADVTSLAGLGFATNNIVFTSLSSIFGAGGVFPIFTDTSMLIYLSYFVCVTIVHLIVDVLLYVVRLCHNIVNHGLGGASHE